MSEQLADSPYGKLDYFNGELRNDAHVDDPTAYRGGSRHRSLIKWSGDHIRPDGNREELVLDQYKRDERHWHLGDPLVGEKTAHLRAPGQSGADTLIETVRFDGVTYHVPIIAAAGIVGGGAVQGPRVLHEGGTHITTYQGDGNIVTRRADEHGNPIADTVVYSSFSGPVAG